MEKFINQIAQEVNNRIQQLPFNDLVPNLYEPIRYTLANGGKRIRPLLMLLSYSLFKDDYMKIINTAMALEVYHNFTLLHDDVMDNAQIRRGKSCVHVKWNENTAILSGDAMLIYAYKLMTQDLSGFQSDENSVNAFVKAMNTFNDATLGVCEGQQWDMDFENMDDVDENLYMEMIRLKTSLLLSSALKMGAQLANADDNDANLLYEFGEKIGLAFQLQDDMLDVYADPEVFGKQVGGDIAENKKTFMLIKALKMADKQRKEELLYWLGLKEFDKIEKYLAVKNIYDTLNIKQISQDKIELLFEQAIRALDKVNVDNEKKNALKLIAQKIMNRNN